MSSTAINDLLQNFNQLADDDKEYFLEIAKKQMFEFRRYKLAKRVKEAEINYNSDKTKSGDANDLLNDLEND